MINDFSKKVELKFWDLVIPLLSNSSGLREVFTKVSAFWQDKKIVRQVAIAVLIAFAGFASGFLIFSIGTLFS